MPYRMQFLTLSVPSCLEIALTMITNASHTFWKSWMKTSYSQGQLRDRYDQILIFGRKLFYWLYLLLATATPCENYYPCGKSCDPHCLHYHCHIAWHHTFAWSWAQFSLNFTYIFNYWCILLLLLSLCYFTSVIQKTFKSWRAYDLRS